MYVCICVYITYTIQYIVTVSSYEYCVYFVIFSKYGSRLGNLDTAYSFIFSIHCMHKQSYSYCIVRHTDILNGVRGVNLNFTCMCVNQRECVRAYLWPTRKQHSIQQLQLQKEKAKEIRKIKIKISRRGQRKKNLS